MQTNSTAGVSGKHTYDAFGRLDTSTGTWNGPFGFGGEYGYQSEASGLQLLGNRWYDPEVGRFLTRDSAKAGRNWYAYCKNSPVRYADLDGLNLINVGLPEFPNPDPGGLFPPRAGFGNNPAQGKWLFEGDEIYTIELPNAPPSNWSAPRWYELIHDGLSPKRLKMDIMPRLVTEPVMVWEGEATDWPGLGPGGGIQYFSGAKVTEFTQPAPPQTTDPLTPGDEFLLGEEIHL